MKSVCLIAAFACAAVSAFSPAARIARPAAVARPAVRPAPMMVAEDGTPEDMWWGDQDYPPSRVLGIGRNVPSIVYGITSGISLGIGCYSFAQSNLVNTLSGQTVNGWYVFGTLGIIYSWGLHVGAWIQKQNGK